MLRRLLAALAVSVLTGAAAQAEVLLDETATMVAPAAPSSVVHEFDITTAGNYELRITDFEVPAALTNVKAALLRDGVIVQRLQLTEAEASLNFDAAVGRYTLSVVGTPGALGIGTLGARVQRGSDAAVLEVSETIKIPNPPPPENRATLDATFTVTTAGDYRVSLADLGFPGALSSVILSVVREGGSGLDAQLAGPGSATFAATPGNYRLFAIGNANPDLKGGVFYTAVRAVATDAAIYRRMVPVGRVDQLGSGQLPAGEHLLTGSDLALPAPLAAARFAVISEGRLVSRLDAPGSAAFTAVAGGHDLLSASLPAAGGSGSYAVEIRRATTPVLSFVNTSSDGAGAGAVTLTGTVGAAGMHRLRLTDFVFPQGFTALRATITQAGVEVGTLARPGFTDVDLAAGTVRVLVFGQANTSTNGIYGVELRPVSGTGATVIEATRGVGRAFAGRQFNVVTAGRYQVFADDLEFPERFAGLDAVVTRGPDVIGSFFGGGSFMFTATPGSYFINFIASPGTTSGGAGTYRMRVADAPALPTVTLTAAPTMVNSGQTTQLSWTTTNATQCLASGAWTGNRAANGSETTAALTAQATYGLECTGPGGTSNAQLVVNVSAPPPGGGGGGGGGALGETLLLGLAIAVLRARRFSARARTSHPS